jgi:class 3 adenylate cyclase
MTDVVDLFRGRSKYARAASVVVRRATQVGHTTISAAGATWRHIVEFFLRLKIHFKFSIIVAISIIVVTFVVSTIAVNLQERELRLQTEVLGSQIVQSLTAVAEDNLLLNSMPVLQDYVKNFSKRNIPGLEQLLVMDRRGVIVAHLLPDSVNKTVTAGDFDLLASADSARLVETPTHFRFIQSIYVTRREGGQSRRFLLGASDASFSKAVLLAPIREMRNKIILASLAVSIVAIGFVLFISKRIVHIIVVLSEAARQVGFGDLRVSVFTRMKDELGSLAKEFNLMVVQIREKVEMQKFVSRSTMEMIATSGEVKLGGTRKTIIAMFSDIRNFTTYSEKSWPEEVVETLNYYLDLQTRIIHEHGGVVDKFLGDGIMSVFSGERMALNAIEAAVDVQRTIARLNAGRKTSGEPVLHVGVGIASGVAVLGSVGSRDRMDYTAIGDTVNLASRLCDIAGPSEIFVSEDVVRRIKKDYRVLSEGQLPIKGKRNQVPVFKVPYSLS